MLTMTSCHCLPEPGRCFPVTVGRAGLEGVAMHGVDSRGLKTEKFPGNYLTRDFCNAIHREKTYSEADTDHLFIRHEAIKTVSSGGRTLCHDQEDFVLKFGAECRSYDGEYRFSSRHGYYNG